MKKLLGKVVLASVAVGYLWFAASVTGVNPVSFILTCAILVYLKG